MPNTSTPKGLIPAANLNGAPYSSGIRQYYHDSGNAQAIYVGDLVTATGASTFFNGQSFPNVVQSATGDIFEGVCVGVLQDTRDSPVYCAASTGRIILVETNPDTVYEIQDNATGTPIPANDIGLNINVLVNQGSTVTGYSGMVLNNATQAGTATLDLKLVGQVNRADNDFGSAVTTGTAAGKFYVRINRSRFANQVAGV